MNRFWKGIIRPIIEGLNPKRMIEIGVDKGDNTRNILEYCSEKNCKLISIDPFPDSSVSELEQRYKDEFTLLMDLSLNVLADIEEADVYFIDGDHNWYTVFNELKTIEDKTTHNFPLIFLHEMEWPYDRRDLYYNPDDIPSEYTHEYAQKGIDLHTKFLVDEYGVNSGLKNALEYGAKKSGVLTAVEDFLDKVDYDLRLIKVPGFHGLGIIYDQNTYLENEDFKARIDKIHSTLENINVYLQKLSYAHYDVLNRNAMLEVHYLLNQDLLAQNKNLEEERIQLIESLNKLQDQLLKNENRIKGIESQLVRIQTKSSTLESKLRVLERSRPSELHRNFRILFSDYISSKKAPDKGKLARLSNFPYLFILLKSKGNIKDFRNNIKGYRAIRRLKLFDDDYYSNQHQHLLIAGINPLIHYLFYGYQEGKNPSPDFDQAYYQRKYPDVKSSKINPLVHYSLYGVKENRKINDRKISVIVTSYNHEKYIKKCIDSILMQKGHFDLEVIVGDDCSPDNTRKIVEEYQKQYPDIINLLPPAENMGVTKNLHRSLKVATGKYVAICEGDDYWTDPYKLQKQANFLEKRPECSICFNRISVFHDSTDIKNPNIHEKLTKTIYTTSELVSNNFIGNFSCCMYRNEVIKKLPDELYDMYTVDWMFNIACSEHGDIGFLNDEMSVYRIHDKSNWSSKDLSYKNLELSKNINRYNEFLSFRYDSEFKKYKKNNLKFSGFQDLIIFDDVFPHPLSAFRFQEYNSYLEHFDEMKIYVNPLTYNLINEDRSFETMVELYEGEFPQFKDKVERFDPKMNLQAKLAYTIFINNVYNFIDVIEKYEIPFAFTLYPGGGFQLNDEISDEKLRRVFSSPYFRKVIVTQKITHDYLLENNFCLETQIEEIFGGVIPLKMVEKHYETKKFFGKDKDTLDICFVAHKYTPDGSDKGYDVFIEVAKQLCEKYDNIYFHVVGNFDENVLDITKIKDRISFYGSRLTEWFDEFYQDKDIIISPNISSKLSDGAFDGFPTGCCTEAGLHKVSIFCTDELNLNTKFKKGRDMVIIPYDTTEIVKTIESYYHDPQKLQKIAEAGYKRIKEIYSYENQVLPRIRILEKIINDEQVSYSLSL
ncbi:MAG: glycosyltransferase [Methanobacterium sp.]